MTSLMSNWFGQVKQARALARAPHFKRSGPQALRTESRTESRTELRPESRTELQPENPTESPIRPEPRRVLLSSPNPEARLK
jgi:hypothetical protein